MSGALLCLFILVGVGATALGLWLLFRRSRLRADLRLQPQPAAPEVSVEETSTSASAPNAAMVAAPDAAEVREDPDPANAEEAPAADRFAGREPAKAAEPACASTPIAAAGAEPEAIEILDDPSRRNAEEAMRGADRHAEALLATAEPHTQAGEATPDSQPLLPETAVAGVAASSGVPEGSASGPAAPAEGEALVRDRRAAEGCTAGTASATPLTAAGESEIAAVLASPMADGTAVLPADGDTTPAGELADANGEDVQQALPEAAAAAAFPEGGAEAVTPDLAADAGAQSGLPETAEEPNPGAVRATRPRPSKPAQHRDRRGHRRAAQPQPGAGSKASPAAVAATLRTPAEARLRLMLHPVRRTVSLSAVLARPAGYPDRITLLLGAGTEVEAYSEDRYDDVDLEWTPGLLSGEVRLDCKEGYQWLRSSRRVHIFSELADEPGLISVGSASLASPSAIVCREDDAEAVRSAAAACGSAEPISHDRWTGVPDGWVVLSGYRPAHAASSTLDPSLTALDPGIGAVIGLSGGLQVRAGSFAQGSPPRIEIEPFPVGARVTIDGASAEMEEDGSWRAVGWDAPGDHLVDVVPGPSLTYRILGDPWPDGG